MAVENFKVGRVYFTVKVPSGFQTTSVEMDVFLSWRPELKASTLGFPQWIEKAVHSDSFSAKTLTADFFFVNEKKGMRACCNARFIKRFA